MDNYNHLFITLHKKVLTKLVKDSFNYNTEFIFENSSFDNAKFVSFDIRNVLPNILLKIESLLNPNLVTPNVTMKTKYQST